MVKQAAEILIWNWAKKNLQVNSNLIETKEIVFIFLKIKQINSYSLFAWNKCVITPFMSIKVDLVKKSSSISCEKNSMNIMKLSGENFDWKVSNSVDWFAFISAGEMWSNYVPVYVK